MDYSLLNKNIYKKCLSYLENITINPDSLDLNKFDFIINEAVNINDLFILIRAYSEIDTKKSQNLLEFIFKFQKSDGSIPCEINTNNIPIYNYAPKPFISYISKIVLSKCDNDFAILIIPKIRKYISWILNYFDPQKKGIHSWKNKNENLVFDNIENDNSSNLTLLLLNELESLKFIEKKFNYELNDNYDFEKDLNKILANLNNIFWNDSKKSYSNELIDNQIINTSNELFYLPLLCKSIDFRSKELILEKLRVNNYITKYIDINNWRDINLDNKNPRLFEKLIFFEALQYNELHGELAYDYLRLSINGINKAYQINSKISQTNAAYILIINNFFSSRYKTNNSKFNKFINFLKKANIDRLDLAIIFLVIISTISVFFWNSIAKIPPPLDVLNAEINNAYVHYDEDKILEIFNIIEKNYPSYKYEYQLYVVNISMFNEKFDFAKKNLDEIRKLYIDSPGPMLTNAILLHLQKKFDDANKIYYEFSYLFGEIYPDIVDEIKIFRLLSLENFPLPLNWKDIYKFRILHEI